MEPGHGAPNASIAKLKAVSADVRAALHRVGLEQFVDKLAAQDICTMQDAQLVTDDQMHLLALNTVGLRNKFRLAFPLLPQPAGVTLAQQVQTAVPPLPQVLLDDLGIKADEYILWPPASQRGVAMAWQALRDMMATFQEHANSPKHAEKTEAALRSRGWFKSHLPAHRRKPGEVDLSLPMDENPVYPLMRQVQTTSQQAVAAFRAGASCVCFVGGGGVGKTTAAFDLLGKEWGLYMSAVAAGQRQPECGAVPRFLRALPETGSIDDVRRAVCQEVLSRMLVLYVLYRRGLVKTPLEWLLAQLGGAATLIDRVGQCFELFARTSQDDADLERWLRAKFVALGLLKTDKPVLVLDEAHVWSHYGQYYCGLPGRYGNLLQAVALCLVGMRWRQVFVGTQMRLADPAVVVASGVGKTPEAELYVVPVSLFLPPRGVLDVLASALPLDLKKPEVLRALAPLSEQLVGRPRFVGSFITSFLKLVAMSEVNSPDLCSALVSHFPAFVRDLHIHLVCRFRELSQIGDTLGHGVHPSHGPSAGPGALSGSARGSGTRAPPKSSAVPAEQA
jgi:hypothetical protein